MSVHDALEEWTEGRISVERALELTGAADVAEMLVLCGLCDVSRPLLTGPPSMAAGAVEVVNSRSSDGPVVSGTRIPAATIQAYIRAGYSDAEIHSDYPTLPVGGVDAVRRWAADLDAVIEMVRNAPDVPPEPGDELPED